MTLIKGLARGVCFLMIVALIKDVDFFGVAFIMGACAVIGWSDS